MMEKAILYVAIYERNEVSKEISINQAVELAKNTVMKMLINLLMEF